MAEIRSMNAGDLDQLIRWAGDEGWGPGLNDAECFWELDPEGFLAMYEHGDLIGGGAIIRHSNAFGFMGLFIVGQAHRGKGLGKKLWFARRDRLLSRLHEGGTIGLDGVDEMVPFYAKGGFQQQTRHRRFQLKQTTVGLRRSPDVFDLRSVDFAEVADFDSRCFPAEREAFLANWISQSGAHALAVATHDKLSGFGVMRPCLGGWKVGPLFADSVTVADKLLQAFQLEQDGIPLFLDVPDANPAAQSLCHKYQMDEVFGCVRMYHGPVPVLDHECIFGVTTLEVG